MIIKVQPTFNKDISKLRDKKVVSTIAKIIDNIAASQSLFEIHNIKKLSGGKHHYRIRIGDFRIGLFFLNGTVFLARFGHRKDFYRFFP